jgi:hypothetical protein
MSATYKAWRNKTSTLTSVGSVGVSFLRAVDQPLNVLCHSVHRVLPPRRSSITTLRDRSLVAGSRLTSWDVTLGSNGKRSLSLSLIDRGQNCGLSSILDGCHDVEVEIVGVRIVRDELRDLNSRDEIFVRIRHEVVVFRLKTDRRGKSASLSH